MGIVKFKLLKSLSTEQIKKAIVETEKELFSLRLKKATRQSFKPNKIKSAKCRLAQLKTLLNLQLNSLKTNN